MEVGDPDQLREFVNARWWDFGDDLRGWDDMVTYLPRIQEAWDEKIRGWSGPMSFYVARQRGALKPDLRVLLLIGKFGDPRRGIRGAFSGKGLRRARSAL
jgi:hypothetical protein